MRYFINVNAPSDDYCYHKVDDQENVYMIKGGREGPSARKLPEMIKACETGRMIEIPEYEAVLITENTYKKLKQKKEKQ